MKPVWHRLKNSIRPTIICHLTRFTAQNLNGPNKVYNISSKRGLPHESRPEFNEINWGLFEGLETTPDYHRLYLSIIEDWKAGLLDRAIDGGETPNQMFRRQQLGLEYISGKRG